jgi:hypothetical protein
MSTELSGVPASPEWEGDPDVEAAYFRAWVKVGGAGRLRRTSSLYADRRRHLPFIDFRASVAMYWYHIQSVGESAQRS